MSPGPARTVARLRYTDASGRTALRPLRLGATAVVLPEVHPFRLRLVEGEGRVSWDAEAQVLTVALPKAETLSLRLSSYLGEEELTSVRQLWQAIAERRGSR